MSRKEVYIVAGGTGGHINAAISIGETLKESYNIQYVTGTRYLDYKLFDGYGALHFDSKPLRAKNPLILVKHITLNMLVFISFLFKLMTSRPAFIIGAGGYICGPTLFAAYILGIPIFILEQNAVMGVTNKILSKIAKKIFVNFKNTKGLETNNKVIISGNPVRRNIKFSKSQRYDDRRRILIFGGSLGASQINEAIKYLLTLETASKIHIKHQVGKDNLEEANSIKPCYQYEQYEYFDDMDKMYNWADIIISRAGASSISEIRIVAKPTLLIPYPAATDNHQYFNAVELKKEASFSVSVIDYKLVGMKLALELKNQIEQLLADDHIFNSIPPKPLYPAAEIIKDEIEKCLT